VGEGPGIAGVVLRPLTRHADVRGAFTETYRREWLPDGREMVQSNLSRSRAGVLRGPHFHRRQADYWVVVEGRMFVGLIDLRRGSATEGLRHEVTLEADDPAGLYIPPGVAHGFVAETDVVFQYLVDAYFDGSDEFGIAWDDPDLGIAWPVGAPIVSDRDRGNPSLAAVLADPPIA
jgi:dTDP-4-dehydrorhamnose 3,5-epimerase